MFVMNILNVAISKSIPGKALGGVAANVDAGLTRVAHLAGHHCYQAPALDLQCKRVVDENFT